MAIRSLDQIKEHQSRVPVAASKVAQSTPRGSLRPTRSFTQALLAPLFAATSFTLELAEQQLLLAKELTEFFVESPSKPAPVVRNAMTVDDAAQISNTAADNAAQDLITTAEVLAKTADDAIQARVKTPDGDSPRLVNANATDQQIDLRAERLVIDKQRQQGEARVRKEIVTETKSFDVPVSHEELVIDRQAVSGDADVDSAPIAAETIRIPLSEDKINIAKQTVVREEVELGKHRVEDVEHISGTVRHEELRVDDPTTNHYYES